MATPQGVIFNDIYVEGRNTKTSEGRSMPLNTDAKKSLKKLVSGLLRKGVDMASPLFGGRKNTGKKAISRQQAWRILKDLFSKANIGGGKLATHSLRKTFADRMKEALNGDLGQVKPK